jgi:predicted 2-oxoglutarate/Fe(II)-dependent dioxygenase YbiX
MSFKIYRNIFTPDTCAELIDMVPALSENFTSFAGVETLRKLESTRRSEVAFYLNQLSEAESQKYCDMIYTNIPNVRATAFRIMHYPTGSCIREHRDSWAEIDGESNSGLIIQLNDPRSYKGGYLTIEKEFVGLDVGDGVYYGYENLHGVTTIKESERWILNVRMFTEK